MSWPTNWAPAERRCSIIGYTAVPGGFSFVAVTSWSGRPQAHTLVGSFRLRDGAVTRADEPAIEAPASAGAREPRLSCAGAAEHKNGFTAASPPPQKAHACSQRLGNSDAPTKEKRGEHDVCPRAVGLR
jgi:hypothetical protein